MTTLGLEGVWYTKVFGILKLVIFLGYQQAYVFYNNIHGCFMTF